MKIVGENAKPEGPQLAENQGQRQADSGCGVLVVGFLRGAASPFPTSWVSGERCKLPAEFRAEIGPLEGFSLFAALMWPLQAPGAFLTSCCFSALLRGNWAHWGKLHQEMSR